MKSSKEILKYEDQIDAVIKNAEATLLVAERISGILEKVKSSILKEDKLLIQKIANHQALRFATFLHNTSLSDALVSLSDFVLLDSSNKNDICLSVLEIHYHGKSEESTELKQIKELAKEYNIKKIRNKILAHKDRKKLQSPWAMYILLMNEVHRKNSRTLIELLKKYQSNKFENREVSNNYISDQLRDGLNDYCKFLENSLK